MSPSDENMSPSDGDFWLTGFGIISCMQAYVLCRVSQRYVGLRTSRSLDFGIDWE